MPQTDFIRVAVEGATTDGRVIERGWIDEMAANFDPNTYGARINMEHIRGYSADAPFCSYGDVLAVKAEDVSIELNGKTEKKRALFAKLDVTDELVELNRKRQKLYTSIEVNPNFAGKGQAYLVGLAVTDSPASLGTEMLQFASKAKVNPFAERKQHADNVITAAEPVTFSFAADPGAGKTGDQGFSIESFLDAAAKKFGLKTEEKKPDPVTTPKVDANTTPDFSGAFAELTAGLNKGLAAFAERFERGRTEDNAKVDQLASDLTALRTQLEKAPDQQHRSRPAAAGASGGRDRADF